MDDLADIYSEIKNISKDLLLSATLKPKPKIIYFAYKYAKPEHKFLSNFWGAKFIVNEKIYYHVEGYYQSQKFVGYNDDVAEKIRKIFSPYECKKESRQNNISDEHLKKWDNELKDSVMKHGVLCKFISNPDLARQLISTGDDILVEHSYWDKYWGDGGKNGGGQNKLGKILMDVRKILNDM